MPPRWQPAERDARFRKRRRAGFPTAISEGDSWFDYPFFLNIIDLVDDAELFAHYRLEASGDTVANMLTTTALRNLRMVVEQEQPLCALFSGGGNDLADRIDDLLIAGDETDPLSCTDLDAVLELFSFIEERYRALVAAIGPLAPIVAHGYDHFVPSAVPVRFNGIGIGIGPWIHPAMLRNEIVTPVAQRTIARWLVNEFNLVLQRIQQDHPLDFIYADLRGTLDVDRDWQNEIHPTRAGFRKLTDRFVQTIRERLPEIVRARLLERLGP